MGCEVYIASQRIDLPKVKIVGSYGVNELGSVEERNGIYTQTFTAPYTNKNKLIMENVDQMISASLLPYQMIEARIDVEGTPLVIGFAKIVSTGGGYEIFVVGGNANWFTLMGDTPMNETDLIELNHKWTDPNVYNSRSNVYTDGYIYPNIDYGEYTETVSTTVNFTTLYPAIFGKYLMQKMFSDIGFTLSGDFWQNNTSLENTIIPFCSYWVRDRNYSLRNTFYAEWQSNENPATITGEYDLHTGETITTPVSDYDFEPSMQFTFSGSFVVSQNRHWLILDSGEVTVDYDLTFLGGGGTPLGQIFYLVYTDANGDIANQNLGTMFGSAYPTTTNFTGSVTVTAQRGPIYIRSQELQIQAGSNFTMTLVSAEDDSDLLIDEVFSYITLGSTLPDIQSMDFLRTIWNQYGIIFATDPQTNYVRIFTLQEVIGNVINAIDWSAKLDRSREPKMTFTLGGYGQKSYFRYAEDESDEFLLELPNYGDGYLSVNDLTLEKTIDIFNSEFAPTLRIPSFDGALEMAYIPKFIEGDENTPTPRICYIARNGDNNITIGANALEPTQPNVYFEDFRFSNLLPLYYTGLNSILSNVKFIVCYLRLTVNDISQLDFSKPIYIDYFGGYFFINNINQFDFTSNISTEVELIRL